MKKLFHILFIVLLTACNNSDSVTNENKQTDTISKKDKPVIADTIANANSPQTKFSVIVLPPYDEIANAGISPDIQKYLEAEILKDTSLFLIKFPYKQLMNVPYQNIFDKRYCKPIEDNTEADVIVMSKLDQVTRTGKMTADKWNFQIRIYNIKSDRQINSIVMGENITDSDMKNILHNMQQIIVAEIKNNR